VEDIERSLDRHDHGRSAFQATQPKVQIVTDEIAIHVMSACSLRPGGHRKMARPAL